MPEAYTYEADVHCESCTEKRFGRNERGFIAEDSIDREGNPVGAVFPWDEWNGEMICGTCGEVIRED